MLDTFQSFSEPDWATMAANFRLDNGDYGLIERFWLHATTRRAASYPQGQDSSGPPR